jgi:hypothetical protein
MPENLQTSASTGGPLGSDDTVVSIVINSPTLSIRLFSTLAMSNILLKSVCKAMEKIAPLRLAEKWDNVRLESLVLHCSLRLNQIS